MAKIDTQNDSPFDTTMNGKIIVRHFELLEDIRVCEELAEKIKPGHTLELVERPPEVGDWLYCQVGAIAWIEEYKGDFIDAKLSVIETGICHEKTPKKVTHF